MGLPGPAPSSASEESPVGEAVAGFRVLRENRDARLLVALLGAQFVAIGALDVLYVVLALGLLGLGESGAGYLNAAFGAGGVIGIAATAALVGRARLAPPLLAGVAVWFAALAFLAAYARTISALVLLAAAGAGRSLVDVAGRTLLQRTAPPELLSRVFGVLEGLTMAGLAIGSVLAPMLVGLAGAEGAVFGVALVPPGALARGPGPARVSTAGRPCRSWSSPCSARCRLSPPSAAGARAPGSQHDVGRGQSRARR